MIGVPLGVGVFLGSFSIETEHLFGKTAHYEGVIPCRSLDPSRCVRTVEINRRHDRVITLATRFHLRTRPVHFEPIVGAVLARTRWSSSSGGGAFAERDYGWRTGGMGGMEARIGSQHFALVPSLRLQFVKGTDTSTIRFSDTETEVRGRSVIPRWSLRAGLMARAAF
jgi:hypothetical protein